MKRMAVLLVILLLGGATLQAAGPMMAQTSGPGLGYSIQAGTAAGRGYQLSSRAWHITGAASGGNCSLSIPDEPSLRGSGCCCTYLPVVLRNR